MVTEDAEKQCETLELQEVKKHLLRVLTHFQAKFVQENFLELEAGLKVLGG